MKKKSIMILLSVMICICVGGAYTIYAMNNFSEKSPSKLINSNNTKINNLHATESISDIQQSNNEKQAANIQQSNNEKQAANIQQSNNEKQQNSSNLDNLLGIYYSSKIVGENKFYGDNTLVLTNKLYAFNGTNISDPIYYIRNVAINNLTTSPIVGSYFGENTQFKIIIPVPSNASSKTIDNYISFAVSHPSNFPCIGSDELVVFNSYKGAVVLKK